MVVLVGDFEATPENLQRLNISEKEFNIKIKNSCKKLGVDLTPVVREQDNIQAGSQDNVNDETKADSKAETPKEKTQDTKLK